MSRRSLLTLFFAAIWLAMAMPASTSTNASEPSTNASEPSTNASEPSTNASEPSMASTMKLAKASTPFDVLANFGSNWPPELKTEMEKPSRHYLRRKPDWKFDWGVVFKDYRVSHKRIL